MRRVLREKEVWLVSGDATTNPGQGGTRPQVQRQQEQAGPPGRRGTAQRGEERCHAAREMPAPPHTTAECGQALPTKKAPQRPSPLLEEGRRAYQPRRPRGASPPPRNGFTARPPFSASGDANKCEPPAHLRRRPWPNVRLGRLSVDG